MNRYITRVSTCISAALIAVGLMLSAAGRASACPFCSAVSLTFAQEMKAADLVVIAELVELPPKPPGSDGGFLPGLSDNVAKSKFRIVEVLKGADSLKKTKQLETIYFGDAAVGTQFFITGIADPKSPTWGNPNPLTKRSRAYIDALPKLPETGQERLAFFQNYLEDEDEVLKRDSYDEFALASYADVKAFGPKANYDQLIKWLNNANTSASHRRLYFTLLGVCGTEKDIPLLEGMLHATDRKLRTGCLDAMIGAYLALKGPKGLSLIADQYLKDPKVDFSDCYAAIQSIRLAQEAGIIEKDKAAGAFHFVLDNPKMADQVVADLARWQDWSVLDRLISLYVTADADSMYVRAPVLRYLQVCPLPEAKKEYVRLAELDPTAAKQAQMLLLPGGAAPVPAEKSAAKDTAKSGGGTKANEKKSPATKPTATNSAANQK